jgi:hypothetical protein
MFSSDEKKFVAFWLFVFGSAISFWALVIHWAVQKLAM